MLEGSSNLEQLIGMGRRAPRGRRRRAINVMSSWKACPRRNRENAYSYRNCYVKYRRFSRVASESKQRLNAVAFACVTGRKSNQKAENIGKARGMKRREHLSEIRISESSTFDEIAERMGRRTYKASRRETPENIVAAAYRR